MPGEELDLLPDATDVAADVADVVLAFREERALVLPSVDPARAQAEIVARMLDAKTWEELSRGTNVVKGAELIGTPLTVTAVRWYPSKHFDPSKPKETPPAFCVLTAYLMRDTFAGPKGDEVIVSLGGWNVFGFLLKACSEGWLSPSSPQELVICQSEKDTAQGRRPIWIEGYDSKRHDAKKDTK